MRPDHETWRSRVRRSTARLGRRGHVRIKEDQPMKTVGKYSLFFISALALLHMASTGAFAQTTTTTTTGTSIDHAYNPPPRDFNDAFYQGIAGDPQHPGNGITVRQW